ncbi:MAG: OsmC family protein [Planctomycetota bacterium]
MTDPELPTPAATCDGGDLDCGSGLLLIIRSAMAPLAPGGALLVKSREVSVKEDLPAWCRMVGHALLDVRGADGGYTHYLLKKKGDDQALASDLQRARDHVWQVRARWTGGMQAKVTMRNHALVVGQPASFDVEDQAASAVEFLLAGLAGAIATGLQWRLSARGIEEQALEVVAKAKSADALVFLGVAAPGNPGLDTVEVAVYVAADCERTVLDALLAETMQRCPVLQTVLRPTNVSVQLRPS